MNLIELNDNLGQALVAKLNEFLDNWPSNKEADDDWEEGNGPLIYAADAADILQDFLTRVITFEGGKGLVLHMDDKPSFTVEP